MAIEDKKAAIGTLVDLKKVVKVVNGWGNNNGNGFGLDDKLNLPRSE